MRKNEEKENSLSHSRLLSILYWDDSIGRFKNKINRASSAMKGEIAGSDRLDGYRSVCIDGWVYLEHRLVWFYFNAVWPALELDHIDLNKTNNRLSNLREVNRRQQLQHTRGRGGTSSRVGIGFHKCTGKWYASIMVDGKRKHLGLFDTEEEAWAKRLEAERKYYPYRVQEVFNV